MLSREKEPPVAEKGARAFQAKRRGGRGGGGAGDPEGGPLTQGTEQVTASWESEGGHGARLTRSSPTHATAPRAKKL